MEEINNQKDKKLFMKVELEITTKEKWELEFEVTS
jgi:hypothetical protein